MAVCQSGREITMKVLILNPILYTAETDVIPQVESIKDTMIYTLCMGFLKNGDEPVLVAADCYRPKKQEDYPFEIKWFPCSLPKICKPRCLPLLKGFGRFLREHGEEYDYIISSEVFSLLTLSAAIHTKKKLIIWHELGAHNNLLKKIPSKVWYNVVARMFMRKIPVIPRSERAADFIRNYCDNVLPVYVDHGVDLDKIYCRKDKEDYFVVLSQLVPRKHIDEIIRRFAEFRKNGHEEYKLQIIGDGILREQLKEQVRSLKEEENILFLGKCGHETVIPVLAGAKALLIYTSKDNSMVSIVESIAAGTPVVTTPVPFNAGYIRENALGIVKDNWGKDELEEISNRNAGYVENCINYREMISNGYFAKVFNQVGGTLD